MPVTTVADDWPRPLFSCFAFDAAFVVKVAGLIARIVVAGLVRWRCGLEFVSPRYTPPYFQFVIGVYEGRPLDVERKTFWKAMLIADCTQERMGLSTAA